MCGLPMLNNNPHFLVQPFPTLLVGVFTVSFWTHITSNSASPPNPVTDLLFSHRLFCYFNLIQSPPLIELGPSPPYSPCPLTWPWETLRHFFVFWPPTFYWSINSPTDSFLLVFVISDVSVPRRVGTPLHPNPFFFFFAPFFTTLKDLGAPLGILEYYVFRLLSALGLSCL